MEPCSTFLNLGAAPAVPPIMGQAPVIEEIPGNAFIIHPHHMAQSAHASLFHSVVHTGDSCTLQDCVVWYFVLPGDVHNVSMPAYVEGIKRKVWHLPTTMTVCLDNYVPNCSLRSSSAA